MKIGKITTTNKKGQVVIPKKIRDMFAITENMPLHITVKDQGVYIQPIHKITPHTTNNSTLIEILKKTQGAWKDENWEEIDRLEKKRRKKELEASKKEKRHGNF